MRYSRNGNIIGKDQSRSMAGATGVWTLGDVADGLSVSYGWPIPDYVKTPGIGLFRRTYSGFMGGYGTSWFDDPGRTITSFGIEPTLTNFSYAPVGDNYSIQWLGYFYAQTTDTYTFYTNSDDCSFVWVGPLALNGYVSGNAIVDNGGTHGNQERSGTISLTAGQYYPIRVQYGESGGGEYMIMYYSNSTVSKTSNFTGLLTYNTTTNGF